MEIETKTDNYTFRVLPDVLARARAESDRRAVNLAEVMRRLMEAQVERWESETSGDALTDFSLRG